ncbi:hypothetical protein SESBI_50754 [Sesbania bispinosa]|nr:hypothetical protein SESBI_50754 [Sesbania bispinosa]
MGSCRREKKKPQWRNGKLIRSVTDAAEGGDLWWSMARQGSGVAWLLQRLAISVRDKILIGSVDSGCGWLECDAREGVDGFGRETEL